MTYLVTILSILFINKPCMKTNGQRFECTSRFHSNHLCVSWISCGIFVYKCYRRKKLVKMPLTFWASLFNSLWCSRWRPHVSWMSDVFLCPSSLLLGKRQEVRIWIDISVVAMWRILILDQSQSGHFRRGLSRWQSSNWLRASVVGRGTAEACRCHIVLVVTNPITPGSLGRCSLQRATRVHLRKQGNTSWKGCSLLGL